MTLKIKYLFLLCCFIFCSPTAFTADEIKINLDGSDIQHMTFNHDDSIIAFTAFSKPTEPRLLHVIDLNLQKAINLKDIQQNIWSMKFSHRDNLLAMGLHDGSVYLHDIDNNQALQTFRQIDDSYSIALHFNPSTKLLAAQNHSLTDKEYYPVRWWDVQSRKLMHKISLSDIQDKRGDSVRSIAFSHDGSLLAIAYSAGIKFWDVEQKQELEKMKLTFTGPIPRTMSFVRSNGMLAIFFSGGMLGLYDIENKRFNYLLPITKSVPNRAPTFSIDGQYFIASDSKLYDVAIGRSVAMVDSLSDDKTQKLHIEDFAIGNMRNQLAIGAYNLNPFKIRLFKQDF